MRAVRQPAELVRAVEDIHTAVCDREQQRYDGVTERGAGPFSIVVPGRAAASIDAYWDAMDPLPWADEHALDHEDVYIGRYDGDIASLFENIDEYTDGAVLIEGDGRIYPYTVELTPDVAVEEAYEDGYGMKMRTALNISAVDVEQHWRGGLSSLQEYFPDQWRDVVATADPVWDPDEDGYGDVVALATSSSTGETRVFDDGRVVRRHAGVVDSRNTETIWEHVLDDVPD